MELRKKDARTKQSKEITEPGKKGLSRDVFPVLADRELLLVGRIVGHDLIESIVVEISQELTPRLPYLDAHSMGFFPTSPLRPIPLYSRLAPYCLGLFTPPGATFGFRDKANNNQQGQADRKDCFWQ